jgi:ribonuclease T
MNSELYFSVDIESSGPIVGFHSMLSLGACVVGDTEKSFYVELQPIGKTFEPAALKVSGFDLDELTKSGTHPKNAMADFCRWVKEAAGDNVPVFVGFNACYDWQFVNWYFLSFDQENPFGFGGVDIKSYFMGKCHQTWQLSSSSNLPEKYQPDIPQTHNALDDAKAQASIFTKLLQIGA